MQNVMNRMGWVLAGLVSLFVIAAVAGIVRGGPLDPAGPPASTMHTLDETAPVWDQKLDSTNGSFGGPNLPAGCNSDRFKCVFPRQVTLVTTTYDGVLDRETGLVWQRVPATSTQWWWSAGQFCANANTAGRDGWRLPTSAELGSLRDQSVAVNPQLPAGSPFVIIVNDAWWWSTTEDLDAPTYAHIATFAPGIVPAVALKASSQNFWCVRGPTSNR